MIRAIDEIGQIVDYVTANRWAYDPKEHTIHIYEFGDLVASVPGSWLVGNSPAGQTDPGVEARD